MALWRPGTPDQGGPRSWAHELPVSSSRLHSELNGLDKQAHAIHGVTGKHTANWKLRTPKRPTVLTLWGFNPKRSNFLCSCVHFWRDEMSVKTFKKLISKI